MLLPLALAMMMAETSTPTLSRERAEAMAAPEIAKHLRLERYMTPEDVAAIESKEIEERNLTDEPLHDVILRSKAKPSDRPGLCVRNLYHAKFKMGVGTDDKTPQPMTDLKKHHEVTIADQCDDVERNRFIMYLGEKDAVDPYAAGTMLLAMSSFKQWHDKLKKGEVSVKDINWWVDPAIELQINDIDGVVADLPAHRIYKVEQSEDFIRLYIEWGSELLNSETDPEVYWVVRISQYEPDGGPVSVSWEAKKPTKS
jgi:hypothetical protein